jgi:hypothetical protein
MFALLAIVPAVAFGQLSAEEIIRRSVEANERDWRAAPEYSYIESTRDDEGARTNEITMLYHSPYSRRLRVNGVPLTSVEQKEEQRKFEKAAARRKAESPRQTAARIAEYEKERTRDHLMMQQLTQAFTFELMGETELAGRQAYELRATPRPGYQPPNMETRVLTGMRGALWVDKETFDWVKVSAEVISPVTIGGFLATVQPGTFFELEKMPVASGVWLPKHFSMRSRAKVMGVFKHSSHEDSTYSGYVKSSTP